MRWHDEKISLPNVPARVDPTIKYSSATHSPKTNKVVAKKDRPKNTSPTRMEYLFESMGV